MLLKMKLDEPIVILILHSCNFFREKTSYAWLCPWEWFEVNLEVLSGMEVVTLLCSSLGKGSRIVGKCYKNEEIKGVWL